MITANDIQTFDIIKSDFNAPIDKIAGNTANTWQRSRTHEEKANDTLIGKVGEYAVEQYFRQAAILYHTWDDLRTDNFRDHAPLDGFLIPEYMHQRIRSDNFTSTIYANLEGAHFKAGFLDRLMNTRNVYGYEVKTTRVTDRHRRNGQVDLSLILRDDFLVYPPVRTGVLTPELLHMLMESRSRQATAEITPPYLIRAYIEDLGNKWRVYLIGYITTECLWSKSLAVKTMTQRGKSERAIYYAFPLKDGRPLSRLAPTIH